MVAGVLSTWSIGLLSLQALSRPPAGRASGFWGTLPSDWDHPEPNYLVSPVVGEFWSVLTTIPVAGALLLQQGIRFGYGPKAAMLTLDAPETTGHGDLWADLRHVRLVPHGLRPMKVHLGMLCAPHFAASHLLHHGSGLPTDHGNHEVTAVMSNVGSRWRAIPVR